MDDSLRRKRGIDVARKTRGICASAHQRSSQREMIERAPGVSRGPAQLEAFARCAQGFVQIAPLDEYPGKVGGSSCSSLSSWWWHWSRLSGWQRSKARFSN